MLSLFFLGLVERRRGKNLELPVCNFHCFNIHRTSRFQNILVKYLVSYTLRVNMQAHGCTTRSAGASAKAAQRGHAGIGGRCLVSSATAQECKGTVVPWPSMALLMLCAWHVANDAGHLPRIPVRLRHFALMCSHTGYACAPRGAAARSRVHPKSGRPYTFTKVWNSGLLALLQRLCDTTSRHQHYSVTFQWSRLKIFLGLKV